MGEKLDLILQQSIRFIDLIFVPLFALMFLIGVLFFLTSFKNPHRKRKAYLFTVIGSIGFFLFLYGPIFMMKYVNIEPTPNDEATLADLANTPQPVGSLIYQIFMNLIKPVVVFAFFLGISFVLLAAKNPPRKRIGIGMIVGIPFVWVLLQRGPDIYRYFVNA